MVGGGRNVDVKCVYASNPYHRCARSCSQRNPVTRRQTERRKSESMAGVKEENRKANPRCKNASNPYHNCSKHCSQGTYKMGLAEGHKPEGSISTVKKVERMNVVIAEGSTSTVKNVERMNVNLKCTYASNPYHACTGNCLRKI